MKCADDPELIRFVDDIWERIQEILSDYSFSESARLTDIDDATTYRLSTRKYARLPTLELLFRLTKRLGYTLRVEIA